MFSFKTLGKLLKKNKKLFDRYLRIILVLLIVYIFYKLFYLKRIETFDNCDNEKKDKNCSTAICFRYPKETGLADYSTVFKQINKKNIKFLGKLSRIILENLKNKKPANTLELDLQTYLLSGDRCCCGKDDIVEKLKMLKNTDNEQEKYDSTEFKDIRAKVIAKVNEKYAEKKQETERYLEKLLKLQDSLFKGEFGSEYLTEEKKNIIKDIFFNIGSLVDSKYPIPHLVFEKKYKDFILIKDSDLLTNVAFEKKFEKIQINKIIKEHTLLKYLMTKNNLVKFITNLKDQE